MALAIRLAAENVEREPGGGPFGAAVFRLDAGALVSVGVNSVVRLHNSALHAEIVALMLAHEALGVHSFPGAWSSAARAGDVMPALPFMCFGMTLVERGPGAGSAVPRGKTRWSWASTKGRLRKSRTSICRRREWKWCGVCCARRRGRC